MARGKTTSPPPSRVVATSPPTAPSGCTGSPVCVSADLICGTVQSGWRSLSSAAAPETPGVAMLVPLSVPHSPSRFGREESTSTPGALTMRSRSRLSGMTAISGLIFNSYKSCSSGRQTRQFIVGQISSNRRMNRVRMGTLVGMDVEAIAFERIERRYVFARDFFLAVGLRDDFRGRCLQLSSGLGARMPAPSGLNDRFQRRERRSARRANALRRKDSLRPQPEG